MYIRDQIYEYIPTNICPSASHRQAFDIILAEYLPTSLMCFLAELAEFIYMYWFPAAYISLVKLKKEKRFDACLRSLSCWKTKLCSSFNHLI